MSDYAPQHARVTPEPMMAGVYTPEMQIMSLTTDGEGRIEIRGFDGLVYWSSELYPEPESYPSPGTWDKALAAWEAALQAALSEWVWMQTWTP